MIRRGLKIASVLLLGLCVAMPALAQDEDYNVYMEHDSGNTNDDGDPLVGPDATPDVHFMIDFIDGDPLQGYQWGVCHDDDLVSLVDGDVVNGAGIEDVEFTFQSISVFEDAGESGWTVGALTNVITDATVDPADGLEMFVGTYTILADEDGTAIDLTWCETLGAGGGTTVRMIVSGEEIEPVNVDLTLEVDVFVPPEAPPLLLAVGTAELTINAAGDTLANASVVVNLSSTDDLEVGAFSFGLTHDAAKLTLMDITLDGTATADTNGGDGPEYFAFNTAPGGGDGGTVGIVISLETTPFDVLTAGATASAIVNFVYEGAEEIAEDDVVDLELTADLGSPTVAIVLSVDGDTLLPDMEAGTVTVAVVDVLTRDFLRGDSNANGMVDFNDVFFTLEFVFLDGEDPICRAAADFNGDGLIGLQDPLNELDFIFLDGESPPLPYPDCETIEEEPDMGENCLEDHEDCL